MKHSTGKPTKAEAERMRRLGEMICIACDKEGVSPMSHTEVHHLLSGNRRRGHLFTIPLCAWHHRGDSSNWGRESMEAGCGPSLALSSRKFHAHYGTDDELLEATNAMLDNLTVRE